MTVDAGVPMIELDPKGAAPILSYNVPDPTSYTAASGNTFTVRGTADKHTFADETSTT
jgi:hypothetical protein